jgi:hypothetical protein
MTSSVLGPETACWLLAASASVPRVPAHPWALADAVAHLAERVDDTGPLGAATRQFRQQPWKADQLTRAAVWRLVAVGRMKQTGSGWHAGHEIPSAEREVARQLLTSLPRAEQRAVASAAQRLVAMVTIWSKNPIADEPGASATI